MAKGKISAKQQEILDFIKKEIVSRGYPPAVRDICDAVHLKSTSSVHAHLETLEKRGFIRRDPTKPRAIEILDDEFNTGLRKEMVNIPLVGTVAAGIPILAEQNIDTYYPIPAESLPSAGNHTFFMLTVKGDSMVNCGIHNGDQIIVEQKETASNGEIIVALVEDSATVKRYYKEKGQVRLQPENDEMDPIIIPEGTPLAILGKVVGLMRFNII